MFGCLLKIGFNIESYFSCSSLEKVLKPVGRFRVAHVFFLYIGLHGNPYFVTKIVLESGIFISLGIVQCPF